MPSKILVIEDNRSFRLYLKDILESAQYEVVAAASGAEGLEMIKKCKPDLILLDIIMPGLDGLDVCRKIRQDKKSVFIKIIMVSNKGELKDRLDGYRAGGDDYIVKPFDKKELLAKVGVFSRLKTLEDQLNEQVRIRSRQLMDAENMAAIGRHTAGIVHNLNNPLGAIMAASYLMAKKFPEEEFLIRQQKAADQMTKIIETILTTSHKKCRPQAGMLDINSIIHDQIELMQADPFFKHKVKTELNLEPLPAYSGVYAHFSQSLGNLLKNAVDAMHESEEKVLGIYTSSDDKYITISVSDTGHGISKENMEKIFNPFFTTKPLFSPDRKVPTGTGLGLASCKEMIESYRGKVLFNSAAGRGAVFTINLPLNEKTV